MGILLIIILVLLCCLAHKRKQKKQNNNHGPNGKKSIDQLKCNVPRAHVIDPDQSKAQMKTQQVPRPLGSLRVVGASELPKLPSQPSPKDSQRSGRFISPMQAAAKTGPAEAVEKGIETE